MSVHVQPSHTGEIGELLQQLDDPAPSVRLHAVRMLAGIDRPEARAGLIRALHDERFGVHWAAADALAKAGLAGVVAVLRALEHDTPATGFLHGAALVLHHARLTPTQHATVAPVLDALHRAAADLQAPLLADAVLAQLDRR